MGFKLKYKNIEKAIVSILLIILLILTTLFSYTVERINGVARVVNYAGIVRGATQRLVKLEIINEERDDIILYLDQIINGLQFGSVEHNLVKVENTLFQDNISALDIMWSDLKREIYLYRSNGDNLVTLNKVSEDYFELANETVTAVENYAVRLTKLLRYTEVIMFGLIASIIIYFISQMVYAYRLDKKNNELSKKAYTDLHTMLPNKSRCEELLRDTDNLVTPTACIIFDINYLKQVNDTLGHIAGDTLIRNFANILRTTIPSKDFVGRYGGDEFMAVIYDTDEKNVLEIIENIKSAVNRFNQFSKQVEMSYSYGYELSTNYSACNLEVIMRKADSNMYKFKMESRKDKKKLNLEL